MLMKMQLVENQTFKSPTLTLGAIRLQQKGRRKLRNHVEMVMKIGLLYLSEEVLQGHTNNWR